MTANDCKRRLMDVLDTEGIFRLIESIPSPNAEFFKLLLVKLQKKLEKNVMSNKNISVSYSIISIINQIGVITSAYIGSLILDFISIKVLTVISILLRQADSSSKFFE